MADETKVVKVAEGAKVYTGIGVAPFQAGDEVALPADHADALLGQGVVEPAPAPAREADKAALAGPASSR